MTHRPLARHGSGSRRRRGRARVAVVAVVGVGLGLVGTPATAAPREAASTASTGSVASVARTATAGTANVGPPSWWDGDCDSVHWNAKAKAAGWTGAGAHRLGASYLGVPVCGPRHVTDGGPDIQWSRSGWGEYEWECPELAMRFMAQIYGVSAYHANGNTVVSNYSTADGGGLVKVDNGVVGKAPAPGDIMSFTSPNNSAGHVAVVAASNVSANGNGSVTLITQNDTVDGWRTLTVTAWKVQPFGSYSPYGWLHDPLGRGRANDSGDHRPFGSWDEFVAQQKADFEGSAGSTTTRATASASLNSGDPSPSEYIGQEMDGAWFGPHEGPVARLYWAYFGRIPDYHGLDHWAAVHRSGRRLDAISSSFAGSSEFIRKYGSLANADFVRLIYTNVLGRPGDASGEAYWTRQLDSGAKRRGQVMTGFSESHEYVTKMGPDVGVELTFAGMLHRSPTTDELTVSAAISRDQLIDQLRLGDEYATRVTS